MALPIRETPILHGEDAEKFAENAQTAAARPISKEDYDRAKKTYEEMRRKTDCRF